MFRKVFLKFTLIKSDLILDLTNSKLKLEWFRRKSCLRLYIKSNLDIRRRGKAILNQIKIIRVIKIVVIKGAGNFKVIVGSIWKRKRRTKIVKASKIC